MFFCVTDVNTLKFERLKISSEIKGNFKLDGNVLEIALQLYSPLKVERLLAIIFWGKKQYIFQTKFFPLMFEGISYNSVLDSDYIPISTRPSTVVIR